MRFAGSVATFRRNVSRGIVWILSKLTTPSVGTPSAVVNSSSETRPRRVRVRAATTTDPMRPATGSRVRIRTGRSPPGVAANQISPRCINRPIRPVLCWAPVGDPNQSPLALVERHLSPTFFIALCRQPIEVASKRFSQEFGTVDGESIGPSLNFLGVTIVDAKAEHCHTDTLSCMTQRWRQVVRPNASVIRLRPDSVM